MDIMVGWVNEKICLSRVLTSFLCDSPPKIPWFNMSREIKWKPGVMHAMQKFMVIDTQVVHKFSIANEFWFAMDLESNTSRVAKMSIGMVHFKCT